MLIDSARDGLSYALFKPRSSSVNAYIDILVCGLVFTVVCLACLARLGVVLMVMVV